MAITYTPTEWSVGKEITLEDMNKIENQLGVLTPRVESISSDYSSSASYIAGDYCFYNNILYRCTQDNTNGEHVPNTSPSYWTPVNVMSEVATGGVGDDIAASFSSSSSTQYTIGQYVVYAHDLYRCIGNTTGGTWDSTKWEKVQLANEVDNLIVVSDTQPVDNATKLWVKPASSAVSADSRSVEVPTYEEFEGVKNSITSEYASGQTYNVGDYAYYNNNLYKCKIAISNSPEILDATKWEIATIGEELADVQINGSKEVLVQSTQPTETSNKLWVSGVSNEEVEVVTADDVANEYSSTKTYAIGEYCYHENTLYKCVTAITSTESWNAAHWVETKIGDELEEKTEDIANLKSAIISILASKAEIIESTAESPVDLDTYTTPGNFKVMNAATAATIINGPSTGVGYRLIVMQTTASDRLIQIAFLNSGGTVEKIAVRNKASDNWNTWQRLASSEALQALSDTLTNSINTLSNDLPERIFSLRASDATTIANGTDLDTLTTPGNFKVTSNANAATLLNCPVSVGFNLKVMQVSQSQRIVQILYSQAVKAFVYRRFYNGTSWNAWERDAVNSEMTLLSNVIITASNVIDYFPNSSFNDAKPNTIYGIYDSTLLTDGPVGDEWTGTADRSAGGIRGTLYTLSQANSHDAQQTGLTQIFVGWRNTNYSPTLSYRIATYSSGSYSWSNWSKFEQNGYLHSSNVIVYGGSMDKSFNDMNDMPSNTIYQLDLNLDGSDTAHTLANHPAPGVSCVAMCYAFSYTSQHGKVQTVYTIDGRLYWRYGYLQAHNDYRWTAWNQVVSDAGDYLRNKGRLENGTDLNTIQVNAIYFLGGQAGANYINNPLTSGAGYLTVKHNGNITLQTVEALGGTRYSRFTENGSTWSNWT